MRPLMVDFFCCQGGAGKGYADAGWDVLGYDILPQPRYPLAFVQADVLALTVERINADCMEWFGRLPDAYHASPKCQGLTELNNDKSRHPNQIPATRALLRLTGKPYTLENVRNAVDHLISPVSLTGTMFDLGMTTSDGTRFVLSRERLFETNWPLVAPADPGPQGHPIANIFGGHLRCRSGAYRTGKGTGRTRDFIGEDKPALAAEMMGMPWATMGGMSEAVPPAMTQYIGEQLLAHMRERAAA